jgi:5-methyltetrahydropteroyltriglutamate--homocysteine methyltransferase
MKTSTDRVLTTHTGSLPRPAELADRGDPVAVKAAVPEIARRQREAGVDIVNHGEVSKPSYATYVTERLTGFEGEPIPVRFKGRAVKDFPEFYEKQWREFSKMGILATPSCRGPVSYWDRSKVETDG